MQKITSVFDMLGILLFVATFLVLGIGLTGISLAIRATWSQIADELDLIAIGQRSWRRFLLGLINGVVFFLLAVILLKGPPPIRLLGLAILSAMIILTLLGVMAQFAMLGRRVLTLRMPSCSIFAQIIAGGLTVAAIQLLPFVGQAIGLAILFQSFGSGIYWLFKRKSLAKQ